MDKQKVGIVTFHTADNYGAVLQAYALQYFIEKHIDLSVNIIDFNTPSHQKEHNVFKKGPDLARSLAYSFFTSLRYFPLRRRIKKFADFRKNYLNLTKHRYDSESDFLKNIEHFDYYISGSDQVFNPNVMFSDCYYLGFDKKKSKKIAYAPSFGVASFNSDQVFRIRNLIKDFDSLSCRESVGASFLSELTGRMVQTVCDPVFLLSKEEWESIIKPCGSYEPYIFIYDLNGRYNLVELAHKISMENGNIPIVCASTNTRYYYRGVHVIRSLGPLDLLYYIQNAQYVVTDSFHGTSLSLILQTKVICYIASEHTSSRIESLAEILNIRSQIVYDCKSFFLKQISFNNYMPQLNDFVEKSREFLKKSLC